MNRIKLIFYAVLIVFCGWGCYGVLKQLKRAVLEHDAIMLEVAIESREEAKWKAYTACLRKHTMRECKEMEASRE
jgi:hypothetical protein